MISLEKILAAAMTYPAVAFRLKNILASDLVMPDKMYRQVAAFLRDFVEQHGRLPKEGDYEAWMYDLEGQRQKGVMRALNTLRSKDVSEYTPEFLADQAVEKLQNKAASNAAKRLQTLQEPGMEDLEAITEEVKSLQPETLSDFADLRDIDLWLKEPELEETISTGIPRLDRYLGGWQNELIFLMADSGIGKSISLVNFGFYAARRGASVLHLTLEVSQQNTALRYYRRMTESDRKDIRQNPEKAKSGAQKFFTVADGDVKVGYREPNTVTPSDLKAMVDIFDKQNEGVDLIILDYLDLMSPPRSARQYSRYDQLGTISHNVRGIAEKFGCSIISATQARRSQNQDYHESLSLHQMGDSYKKVRAADVILGLVQTPEEAEMNQARLEILKVREKPGRGKTIPCYFNKDIMMLADIDHPNTKRVMDRYGDRPTSDEIPEGEGVSFDDLDS